MISPLTILVGDVREKLRELPDESVNCVVTSPPYWGLRDYGVAGQLGLEKTLDEYISTMTAVFEEVRRVLRKDGTLWLNCGDSYNGYYANQRGTGLETERQESRPYFDPGEGLRNGSLKPKDLCGVPWRIAFALQAAGWWLRCDIIWHKPNPMPESCEDRPTHSHEYIFLMTKSERYWYDAIAIAEPVVAGFNGSSFTIGKTALNGERKGLGQGPRNDGPTRNKRSVWTVPSQPYPGKHFAVFPEKLITPCILAGCPAQTCAKCGMPWERVIEIQERIRDGRREQRDYPGQAQRSGKVPGSNTRGYPQYNDKTLGWRPTCKCECPDTVPGVVLDPFAGSGTTGKVALEYGRRAILIELNPEYVKQIEQRTETTLGLPVNV